MFVILVFSACLDLVWWLLLVGFVGLLDIVFEVACFGVVLRCCFLCLLFLLFVMSLVWVFCLCYCNLLEFLFCCGVCLLRFWFG